MSFQQMHPLQMTHPLQLLAAHLLGHIPQLTNCEPAWAGLGFYISNNSLLNLFILCIVVVIPLLIDGAWHLCRLQRRLKVLKFVKLTLGNAGLNKSVVYLRVNIKDRDGWVRRERTVLNHEVTDLNGLIVLSSHGKYHCWIFWWETERGC